MESKKINTKEIKALLGLEELSPMEAAEIEGGEVKCKCKNCACNPGEPEPLEEIEE